MRKLILILLSSLIVGLPISAAANTLRIEIRNGSPNTAYVVTAFASELVPNFRNLTTTPLPAGARRTITVFDDYNKCIFTVSVDFNPLQRSGRKFVRRQKPFSVFQDLDFCKRPFLNLK